MKLDRRRRTYFKQLESTALTDIVFLLLIFFLLTSTFVTQTGIKINLPNTDKPIETKVTEPVSIAINSKEQIFLNEDLVRKDELEAKLRAVLSKRQDKTVVFRPDKLLQIQSLVEVMDIASVAGGVKLVIATKKKANE